MDASTRTHPFPHPGDPMTLLVAAGIFAALFLVGLYGLLRLQRKNNP